MYSTFVVFAKKLRLSIHQLIDLKAGVCPITTKIN